MQDWSRILKSDALLAQESVAETHMSCLYDALKPDWPEGPNPALALARCHAFIERRAAIGLQSLNEKDKPPQQVLAAFIGTPWRPEVEDELEALLRAYAGAGYIDLTAPIASLSGWDERVVTNSALEYAISKGRTRVVRTLLDLGAPTQGIPTKEATADDGGRRMSFVEYVEVVSRDLKKPELLAIVHESQMRSHLAGATGAVAQAGASPLRRGSI